MIQDTTRTGQLCIPCATTSRMVYCRAVTTYLVTSDATKGNLTEGSTGNCDAIRSFADDQINIRDGSTPAAVG